MTSEKGPSEAAQAVASEVLSITRSVCGHGRVIDCTRCANVLADKIAALFDAHEQYAERLKADNARLRAALELAIKQMRADGVACDTGVDCQDDMAVPCALCVAQAALDGKE